VPGVVEPQGRAYIRDTMGRMIIRDDAVWAKHIDDPEIVRRILALPPGAPMTLLVDRNPVRFRKMRDGADGRPTDGLRPR
jgi:hypothetical protein